MMGKRKRYSAEFKAKIEVAGFVETLFRFG